MPRPLMVYLDNAASTPIAPEAAQAMQSWLQRGYANPSANHVMGQQAAEAIEKARQQIASLIHALPDECIFTSGATEANNLAIRGAVAAHGRGINKPHIITTAIEHKSVLETCAALEPKIAKVTYLQPDADGRIYPSQFEKFITDKTVLCSIHLVNNELGVIQDIMAIGVMAKKHNIKVHVDASQAVGKLPLNWRSLPVDYLSFSAHKFYGPKGIGALFVRKDPVARLVPQQLGGAQENNLRAGTLPTHQIVSMGAAAEVAAADMEMDKKRLTVLSKKFIQGLNEVGRVSINGEAVDKVAHIISATFHGCHGEALQLATRKVMASSGSACNSDSDEPSYVLKAIGLTDHDAEATLRFSLGRYTTEADIEVALDIVSNAVAYLRNITDGKNKNITLPGKNNETNMTRAFFNAYHHGSFTGEDINTALEQSAAYGDSFTIYEKNGEYRWKAWGCPELLAALSWTSSQQTLKKGHFHPNVNDISDYLALPAEKRYVAVMVASAWQTLCPNKEASLES